MARLIVDEKMRSILFPLGDDDLAIALREINEMASSEGFRYLAWTGFGDQRILEFLAAHPPDESPVP